MLALHLALRRHRTTTLIDQKLKQTSSIKSRETLCLTSFRLHCVLQAVCTSLAAGSTLEPARETFQEAQKPMTMRIGFWGVGSTKVSKIALYFGHTFVSKLESPLRQRLSFFLSISTSSCLQQRPRRNTLWMKSLNTRLLTVVG